MAKQITQETFDAVVTENIAEFEMEPEEALNDAVSQFEAQGVNLANIVKDLSLYSGSAEGGEPAIHPVVAAVENLKTELKKDSTDKAAIKKLCETIQAECEIDLARRCLAGKNGAYPALVSACKTFKSDEELLESFLSALCALTNGQPDLLDEEGIVWNCELLRATDSNATIAALLVKLMRLNCTKHETNRQKYVAGDIVAILSHTMSCYHDNPSVLHETCAALRVLTYDDDVRVPFGKGHEHAKMIVTEENALKKILDTCNDFKAHESLLAELYQTLTSLAVRNEFCQEIMDLGGVKLMIETIEHNTKNQALIKQVLGVLKTISGNDQVKIAIVEAAGIELILSAMSQHARSAPIAEMGCAALASLALRNPDHSNRIMAASGAETIVKALQIHTDKASVQKQACMAIRNVVARRREYTQVFVMLGVEDLINAAGRRHPSCADEVKAALRDLELKVELKCLWMGEGKGIRA